MIGLIYFVVIVLANTVGAISGMGGGVLIKPILDLIGAHSVAGISLSQRLRYSRCLLFRQCDKYQVGNR